ncbi:MAG: carbohydrate porin [Planctomycetes bacterium]|nr:carbohydrate porin [Planctomycetota bacterium]
MTAAPAAADQQDGATFLKETADTLGIESPDNGIDLKALDLFGHRSAFEKKTGIGFEGGLVIDYSKPLMGGLNTEGDSFRHLLDLRLNWNVEQITGIKGGTFSIDFMNQNGDNGSNEVGDLQAFGGNDTDGRTQISEVWYEQYLFKNKLRLKVGKVDGNSEFAFVECNTCDVETNSQFIHSFIAANVATILAFPAYPDPAMSVNAWVHPFATEDDAGWLYAGVGVYDGQGQSGTVTGTRGPATFFDGPDDYFIIGELGVCWSLDGERLPGMAKVGGWGHTGDFETFSGSVDHGTEGFYVVAEQTIWHPSGATKDDPQAIKVFGQYGYADANVSDFDNNIGGGFLWVGAIPKRYPDTIGLGFSTVTLSDQNPAFTESNETAIELFYGWQVRPWLMVKPDLQYIVNPGGEGLDDALVATVRVIIGF